MSVSAARVMVFVTVTEVKPPILLVSRVIALVPEAVRWRFWTFATDRAAGKAPITVPVESAMRLSVLVPLPPSIVSNELSVLGLVGSPNSEALNVSLPAPGKTVAGWTVDVLFWVGVMVSTPVVSDRVRQSPSA